MPYRIEQGAGSCGGYAVVVTTTGRVVGCHPSRERAERHRRALYANVPEAREKAGLPDALAADDSLAAYDDLLADDGYWATYERRSIAAARPLLVAVYMAGVRAALGMEAVEETLGQKLPPSIISAIKRARPMMGAEAQRPPLPAGRPKRGADIPTAAQLRRAGAQAVNEALHQWGAGITQTAKRAVVEALNTARREGHGAAWVAERIRPYFSGGRARAIAVTEVTRYFAAGAMETYKRLGLERWVWQTVEDSRVCDECERRSANSQDAPLMVGVDETPPAHPLCRCFPRPATRKEIAAAAEGVGRETPWGVMPTGLSLTEKLKWIEEESRSQFRLAYNNPEAVAKARRDWLAGNVLARRLAVEHWESLGPLPRGDWRDQVDFMQRKYPWTDWQGLLQQNYLRAIGSGDSGAVALNRPDNQTMDGVLRSLDLLNMRHPEVALRLRRVNMDMPGGGGQIWDINTYAATAVDGSHIGFNPEHLNHADGLSRRLAGDSLKNFHPQNADIGFITTHEYGHAVQANLEMQSPEYRVASGRNLGDLYDPVRNSRADTTEYGKSSRFEHFAQAYAEWQAGYPTEGAQEMASFFEAIGSPDDWALD